MKKILFFLFISMTYIYANNMLTQEDINQELDNIKGPYNENVVREYIKVFHDISQERKVMDEKDVDLVQNPFVVPVKTINAPEQTSEQIEYKLHAILEDRANINNKWYKQNDMIKIQPGVKVKLLKIKKDSVVLRIANTNKEIQLNKGIDNVKISFQ